MTRYFTEDHEWIEVDGDSATVGITHYAQSQLGDIVFAEVPAAGATLKKGGDAAVEGDPALVNSDPEGEGWFFKLTLSESSELDSLMNAAAYQAFVDGL